MSDNPQKLKRIRTPNKNSMRNMVQYKNMSDDEFNSMYNEMIFGVQKDEVEEEKFNRLMRQFEEEYDLSEMLPNDRVVLKNLISAMVQLDNYMAVLNDASREGINQGNILVIDKVNAVCKSLRSDISDMQRDLKITRNVRKSDKEQSVLNYLEELKLKAKTFAQQKMHYIFCEKCGQLLATVWWQRNNIKKNSITVHCERILDDGTVCDWSKKFTAEELTDMGMTNKLDQLPESMR